MTSGFPQIMLTTDAVGGVWQYTVSLAAGLIDRGYGVHILTLGPTPDAAQRRGVPAAARLTSLDAPVEWMAASPAELADVAGRIAHVAEAAGADLLQLHSASLAPPAPPCPVIAMQHSCLATWWRAVRGDAPPKDFEWRIEAHAAGLRRADLVTAPSSAFAQMTAEAYDLPRRPVTVHNGRAPLGVDELPPGDFVLTVGRLWDDSKNVAVLDAAARHLTVPVLAAGPLSGPNGETRRFDHLSCLGRCEESAIADLLSARPVFASTAVYEPFGLAVLEAAQAGCALVLSDIPVFRELWDGAALFAPPGDAAAFRAAIDGLFADAQRRRELGAAARLRSRQFTPGRMVAGMMDVYGRVTAERAAA
ncbi:glycosyltransferase family 4 protein [Pacificimonas flava]|uniref:Putative glycosyl transferase n=1 Tax=Pacificimonas flava TaxID=1234595 RepID=M2U5I5_9SPHN|nr:glycosyltransferase family 4 protein [Pacificimonas flava]EMD83282.1 putative glycosyl transferase [Pacificimonas flava]MBB5279157.1 glycosyltransferase involved in cell wall biosynthesis [Pacificimonas flava]